MESNISERLISSTIFLLSLVFVGICTSVMVIAKKEGQDLVSMCFDLSKEMEDATGAIGGPNVLRIIVIATGFLFIALETYAYSSIYVFLTRHDRSMINILPTNTIAVRGRQNAINLSCHLIQFIVDLALLIGSLVLNKLLTDLTTRHYSRYLSLGNYGLTGFLCIVSNSGYRQNTITMFKLIFQIVTRPIVSYQSRAQTNM